ncbi:hypothetical protein L7F22_031610 [Adiantum nelumboides]|nr:hypothetical protein [Adiantum nelumboides]
MEAATSGKVCIRHSAHNVSDADAARLVRAYAAMRAVTTGDPVLDLRMPWHGRVGHRADRQDCDEEKDRQRRVGMAAQNRGLQNSYRAAEEEGRVIAGRSRRRRDTSRSHNRSNNDTELEKPDLEGGFAVPEAVAGKKLQELQLRDGDGEQQHVDVLWRVRDAALMEVSDSGELLIYNTSGARVFQTSPIVTDTLYADKQFVLRIDVPQRLLSVACRIWNAVQVNKKQTVYALILCFDADVNTTYEQAMSEAREGIQKAESEPSTAMALQSQSRDDLELDLLTKRFGSPSVSTKTLDSIMDGLKMDGWALLHLACYMDDVGMVELLLQYGAQVNVRDSLGRTPLHNCILYRRNTVAKLLLARGASPAAVDEDGKTPLQVAMELGAVTDEELFVLLSNGTS